MRDGEVYDHYSNWCWGLGIVPATFERWMYIRWTTGCFKWN